jgi:hypothetical protein
MSAFAEAIRYLTADEDPARRITAIKTAVIENLQATDERVRIEVTNHFNHSYVPDLILSWSSSSEERRLFLRTSFRAWDLMEDLTLLADERPILMPLAPIEQDDRVADEALQTRSRSQRTLITNPYGLEALDDETNAAPVVSLLSHAILQGGRGLITSHRAREVSEEVSAGFQGAQSADYESTSIAVRATEDVLDSHRASQLTSLLHAVWVGSGASPSQFPGATGTTAVIDAESLKFILDLPGLEDPDFWDRLGRGLTTERLCQLIDLPASANLERLLRSNAHRLQSKACRVIAARSGVATSQWEIVASTLTLRTAEHRIHFAPRHLKELPESSLPVSSVSVGGLRTRAARAHVKISEVRLTNGDSTITYGSDDRPDIVQDQTLVAVEEAVRGATVASAVARIGDGNKTVRCNLTEATASGNGNAMYYVAELAVYAAPLLTELSVEEFDEIRSRVSAPLTESHDLALPTAAPLELEGAPERTRASDESELDY